MLHLPRSQIVRHVSTKAIVTYDQSFKKTYKKPVSKKAITPRVVKQLNDSNPHQSFNLNNIPSDRASFFFQSIATKQAKEYKDILKFDGNLPPKPQQWLCKPGWYRYTPHNPPEKVEYPPEDLIVFDVERLYKISQYPTLATACSKTAWYGWVSKYIAYPNSIDPTDMIVLNPENKTKVVVAHNAGFDRAQVIDGYRINSDVSNTFFLDTLALYFAGYSFYTRENMKSLSRFDPFLEEFFENNEDTTFYNKTIKKNTTLKALYERFVPNAELDKDLRAEFDATDKKIIIKRFQSLMNYCSDDTAATFELLMQLYPRFEKKILHPSQLVGLKEIGNSKVVVDPLKWQKYQNDNETLAKSALANSKKQILKFAKSQNIALVKVPAFTSTTLKDLLPIKWKPPFEHGSADPGFLKNSKSLLYKRLQPLWENGSFQTENSDIMKFIDYYYSSSFWTSNKKRVQETPINYFKRKEYGTILPMVKSIGDCDLSPVEPLWLSNPSENSIGAPVDKLFTEPQGFKTIGIKLDHDWLKSIILSQDLKKVSPFIIREHFEKLKVEYLYNLLTGVQEIFSHLKIRKFHLLTTFNKELKYIIEESNYERGQVALEIVEYWVKSMVSNQTGIGFDERPYKTLSERADKLFKGVGHITFNQVKPSNQSWSFKKYVGLVEIQNYLKKSGR
ncbi:hypothetical protein WICMUC_000300 [Wickerhamomyces mucosus]|uniref:DNA mitochondrial polymerase exonuclease domain-containing protein n=1 Tax=Wickerhamomyces mucosus TaxID=1378264 RepID=A0A9P8PZM5_9ASCO|nr:hypothetical protein WICMUC_000300 [Wickerhamomyces mucosus]